MAAKGAAIVEEVLAALTDDAATVAANHRQRFQRLTQRRLDAGALCLDDACAIDIALAPQS